MAYCAEQKKRGGTHDGEDTQQLYNASNQCAKDYCEFAQAIRDGVKHQPKLGFQMKRSSYRSVEYITEHATQPNQQRGEDLVKREQEAARHAES
jgi:hypothetical protein